MSQEARDHTVLELVRAGLALRVGEYVAIRLATAVVVSALSVLVLSLVGVQPGVVKFFLALVGLGVGWLLPRLYVSRRANKRLEQVEKQLPHALTSMGKALRAGAGLLQALAYAADETPAPLGPELQTTLRDLQLGAEADDVFEALKERVGSRDLNIAVTAIVVQRTVGGNLSEILGNVTNTIRERAKIAGEIRVLTARQRITSNLIAILPILVAIAFLAINREMGKLLFTTLLGQIALGFSLALEVFGIWLIRRLGVIEI
jgi:tight adherence protein B